MASDVRTRAFSAVKWTAASMLVRAALALAQLFILSRLLDPRDFGLLAMALSVLNLVVMIADFGLSSALIHFRDISERQRSTIYWLGLAAGFACTITLSLLSPLIAGFYREAELTPVLMLASCVFIATAFGQQVRVMAERALRFRPIAQIEIAAAVLGLAATIGAALLGWGVYAIVSGTLLAALSTSLFAWIWLSAGWRPQLVFAISETGRFLQYGMHAIGVNLANAIGLQGDLIVSGRLFASMPLGLYFPPREIGMRVMMVVNPIVTRIGFPLIAELQHDPRRVASIYRQTVLMTASINFPIYAALALFAPQVVALFFGPGWDASAPLMRAVAIWCAVRSIGNPMGSLLMGMGHARRALVSSTVVSILVLTFAMVGGTMFGIIGVPYALAALYALLIVPFWLLLIRPTCGLGFAEYHVQLIRPLACTAVAVLGGWLASLIVTGALPQVLAGGVAGAIAYFGASLCLNRGWLSELKQLLSRAVPDDLET